MRGLTRRWVGPTGGDEQQGGAAGKPLHERVIHARGLGGVDRADRILRTPHDLGLLHDASLLPGANAVAEKLVAALRAGKRIAIHGDYDADGITALAVLWHVLRAAAPDAHIERYLPSRFEYGYGLHADVLRQMHARGIQVVVTVDCGITAVEPAKVARELGMQLLITDHHLPDHAENGTIELPDADAICHPALPGARAPFAELCGAAVAYKVALQFARAWCGGDRVATVLQEATARVLPLVALGTVADIVPLVDENRVFVAAGLSAMPVCSIPGIRALLADAQLGDGSRVNSEHVAFRLAPRLNAVGRLGHAAEALELLTTADATRAREIAQALAMHNDNRRAIEQGIFAQACELVERAGMHTDDRRGIVLAHAGWHEGVVGVVCSKLVDRYNRPAILLCERPDGTAKGSARAPEGFDLAAALRECSAHLGSHGGHAAAAGLSVRAGAMPEFTNAFTRVCGTASAGADLMLEARYDTVAGVEELNLRGLRGLDVLRPFGRGNREPAVRVSDVQVHTYPREFGATRTHLEVHVKSKGVPLRAVWWNGAQHAAAIARAPRIDLIAHPKIDSWKGTDRVQLDLVDIAPVR